ncbi:MAG: SPFH domain-containing protein [Armatimonadetes bacterium]|jgi:regulator of protease activity HflC (stomatin/prohibitin superfamily)|nr:SPFH domain-containing protein [Armatimonadota bacterium]
MFQNQQQQQHPKEETSSSWSKEKDAVGLPGGIAIVIHLLMVVAIIYGFTSGMAFLASVLSFVLLFTLSGYFTVAPGESFVLMIFGKYVGTVKKNGIFWALPWASKQRVSLRTRTLNGQQLKVNDSMGNPIEIACVIVWKVTDTYRSTFEVQNYESFVAMQSETAIRHIAATHPYDSDDDRAISLRRNASDVCDDLVREIQTRLAPAGVTVTDASLSHLAYSPEIAGAMLRRQQAAAIISARQRIVEGAVGMVEMALQRIDEKKMVQMTEPQKAAMVANLMTVLCSEQSAQPVVNTSVQA